MIILVVVVNFSNLIEMAYSQFNTNNNNNNNNTNTVTTLLLNFLFF